MVVINIGVSSVVCLSGTVTNVITVIFDRQGFRTAINISFFAMALPDLVRLICQQWFNLCVNPLYLNANISLDVAKYPYITGSAQREARVVCMIIAFMIIAFTTAVRCLCVASPLHVKQIVTSRIANIYVVAVYDFSISCNIRISCQFSGDTGTSILGFVFTSSSVGVMAAVYLVQALGGSLSFLPVNVFKIVLAIKPKSAKLWSKTLEMDPQKLWSSSNIDMPTIRLIVFVSVNFIVYYAPSLWLFMVTVENPVSLNTERYADLVSILWFGSALLGVLHSSLNIVLYLRMSTQ